MAASNSAVWLRGCFEEQPQRSRAAKPRHLRKMMVLDADHMDIRDFEVRPRSAC